jgi:hypothetical protein
MSTPHVARCDALSAPDSLAGKTLRARRASNRNSANGVLTLAAAVMASEAVGDHHSYDSSFRRR